MPSSAITTVVKMLETLPGHAQDRVIEHLRIYIDNLQDEMEWDLQFEKTQPKLIEGARQAKEEIAKGLATPLDESRL